MNDSKLAQGDTDSELAALRRALDSHTHTGIAAACPPPDCESPQGPTAYFGSQAAESAPCEECAEAGRCARLLLACRMFVGFVEHGGADRWSGAPRQPTRKIFNRIFADVTEAPSPGSAHGTDAR